MKLRSVVSLLALLSFSGLSAAPVDDLTLPERAVPGLETILRNATSQSPRMVSRSLELEIAENNRISARAGLLPYVNGNYRHVASREDRADLNNPTNAEKMYYDLSVSQPLYFWGERRNSARVGEISKQIANGNFKDAYRGLVQELRQKYLFLIVQKVQFARARAQLAFAQQQLKLAEERLAKKVISDLEIYPFRVGVEQSQIAFERTEFDYENSRHSFSRLAGIPDLADGEIPDAIPAISYAPALFDSMLGAFLSQREFATTEAVNARSMLAIEDLNVKITQTRLRPKVSVVGGVNQDETSYTLNTAQKYRVTSLYAGLQVNWAIFDGFASQSAVRNSLLRKRQAEAEYAETVDRIARQAQGQVKQINFSARSMAIADRGLSSGEGNVQSKRGDFQRGIASEADVTMAELQLLDAKINAFGVRADYLGKVGDFLGTLNQDPAVAYLPSK